MLGGVVNALHAVWCAISAVPFWIVSLLVVSVNGLILLVALAVAGVLALLPVWNAPSVPAFANELVQALNAVIAVPVLAVMLGATYGLYVAYVAISIVLRWFKVIE